VSLQREWWLRVLAVLVRPRLVFLALRVEDDDDLEARREPVLLITLLAGMAGVLLSSTWGRLLDQGSVDGLVVAVVTFIGGIFYGAGGYFVVGGALYLGARTVGSLGSWRLARQVLAFACVPLALSLFLTLPVGLAVFGGDLFRSGGSDEGRGGDIYLGYRLAFGSWSLGLLIYGVRTTYGWSWLRSLGALGLLVGFMAIFSLIALVL
jgi:Yip1 domain